MKKTFLYLVTIFFSILLITTLISVYQFGVRAYALTADVNNENFGKYISTLGALGDFFGGLTNPIIGAIGSLSLIVTITLQIQQNKKTLQQSYETGIFNLINLQNNIIENLEYEGSKKKLAFSKFLSHNNKLFFIKKRANAFMYHNSYSQARVEYKIINEKNNEYFGHYFRNLYSILKAIDELPESYKRKKYFARIVRAQLSMNELTVLFLNCLPGVCDDGKFAKLLIKYQILEHLLINPCEYLSSFEEKKTIELNFKIGGSVIVSINEVAFYIFGENTISKIKKHHGAFGRNNSESILKTTETVLARKNDFIPIYGDISGGGKLSDKIYLLPLRIKHLIKNKFSKPLP